MAPKNDKDATNSSTKSSLENRTDTSLPRMATECVAYTDGNFSASPAEMTEVITTGTEMQHRDNDGGETTSPLSKKYRVFHEIARGGMGRIVLWKDRNIQRVVASKLLLPKRANSAKALQRFIAEAQITGQLEHPNIVPIYELGEDERQKPYFTMKYVKGQSLQELLTELQDNSKLLREKWTLSKMLQVFQSICHALEYAHSKKVIHRDLKPSNIMLGNFGEVVVMDWGLAKVLGSFSNADAEAIATIRSLEGFETMDGQIAGTPLYMSPEQAKGEIENIDYRSDIYSLGTILYEIVTGTPSVEGQETLTVLSNVTQGKVKDIPRNGPWGKVPRELKAIITKALKFSPKSRYQSVRDLEEDIQKYIDGREVTACLDCWFYRTLKLYQRYRKEILLVAATLAIVALSAIIWQGNVTCRQRSAAYAALGQASQSCPRVYSNLKALREYKKSRASASFLMLKIERELAQQRFTELMHAILDSIHYYRKAHDILELYDFKKREAKAWQVLFEGASLIGKNNLREMARYQIKKLLTEQDFRKYAAKLQ